MGIQGPERVHTKMERPHQVLLLTKSADASPFLPCHTQWVICSKTDITVRIEWALARSRSQLQRPRTSAAALTGKIKLHLVHTPVISRHQVQAGLPQLAKIQGCAGTQPGNDGLVGLHRLRRCLGRCRLCRGGAAGDGALELGQVFVLQAL